MTVATSWSTAVTLPEGPYPDVAVEAQLRFDTASPYAVCLAFPRSARTTWPGGPSRASCWTGDSTPPPAAGT